MPENESMIKVYRDNTKALKEGENLHDKFLNERNITNAEYEKIFNKAIYKGRKAMDLSKIKEVKQTTHIVEVNKFIENDWILFRVVPNQEKMLFALGRTRN